MIPILSFYNSLCALSLWRKGFLQFGQCRQAYSYTTLDFIQEPPDPLPCVHATQSPPWQPPLVVGFDFCTVLFIVLPPLSTTLNFNPGMAATSLNICRSSEFGVGGMIIGAMHPPLVAQVCFLFIFSFLLSSFCQSFGLLTGFLPSSASFSIL